MNLDPDERDLMTRVVLGESSSDPTERAGVAWNILNRVGQPEYGNSIRDVVYQKNAYTSVNDPKSQFYRGGRKAYADARAVVDSVASGDTPDPTGGAPNFLAASMPPEQRPKWGQGEGQKIGKTVFFGGNPSMSKSEADQYLANRRASQQQTEPSMSRDEADAYLAQRRAAQPAITAAAGPTTNDATTQASAQQPQESFPQGVGLSTLFHDLPQPVQEFIKAHPYLSGGMAAAALPLAVAAIPEGAIAAGAGVLGRNILGPLIKGGAGVLGMGKAADFLTGGQLTPKLIDLLTRGLSEH